MSKPEQDIHVMAFRFIHTADIHLDSPLRSLALRHQELADLIANATRKTFMRIVDLCIDEQVDALLVAGDLYDGDQTSMKTARFFASEMRRLSEAGIAVFIIRGNHDAESKVTRELTLPDNVHVFGHKAGSVEFSAAHFGFTASATETEDMPVVLHGVSFKQPHAPESLLPEYPAPVADAFNIGLLHTSLDGAVGHDPYAPCTRNDLQTHGFDYWALGHIHKRLVFQQGDCTIVMPGIPQGRDIGEAGVKTVSLVTLGPGRKIEVEEKCVSVAQFEWVSVSLTGVDDWSGVIDRTLIAIDKVNATCGAEQLVARVSLTGKTELLWQLQRDHDLLLHELRSRLSDEGGRWIEKLVVDCDLPDRVASSANGHAKSSGSQNPLFDLRQLMHEEIKNSSHFHSQAQSTVMDFCKQLPAELRAEFGNTAEEIMTTALQLANSGTTHVIAHLHANATQETSSQVTSQATFQANRNETREATHGATQGATQDKQLSVTDCTEPG